MRFTEFRSNSASPDEIIVSLLCDLSEKVKGWNDLTSCFFVCFGCNFCLLKLKRFLEKVVVVLTKMYV